VRFHFLKEFVSERMGALFPWVEGLEHNDCGVVT
jgi:hypothetical protein